MVKNMQISVSFIGNSMKLNVPVQKVSAMNDAILKDGWDGEWFVRAYDAYRRQDWFQGM